MTWPTAIRQHATTTALGLLLAVASLAGCQATRPATGMAPNAAPETAPGPEAAPPAEPTQTSTGSAAQPGTADSATGTAPRPRPGDARGEAAAAAEGCWAAPEAALAGAAQDTAASPAAAAAAPRRTPGPAVFEALCPAALTPERIATLQRALAARGLHAGPVTGRMDAATADAVRAFQRRQGLDSATLSLAAARALGIVAHDFSGPDGG